MFCVTGYCLINTDHFLLDFESCGTVCSKLPVREVYNWHTANFEEINYKLQCKDLDSLIDQNIDVNIMWYNWKYAVFEVINGVVSKSIIKN